MGFLQRKQAKTVIPDDLPNTLREKNTEKIAAVNTGEKKLDLLQIFYCVGNIMKGV